MPKLQCKGHCQTCNIRSSSIFSGLSKDQLESIKDFHTSVYTYEPGEIIYLESDAAKFSYTLRKGLVKQSKSQEDGRVQILNLVKTGGLFGFDGFAENSYNSTATALVTSEVCRLPVKELNILKTQHPEINDEIMTRWLQYIRDREDMLVELGTKKASQRLSGFLLKWCSVSSNDDWIALPLSRSELGELLGLTIETVSRFSAEWKRMDFIKESKGMIKIVDPEGLINHVSGS